MNTEHLTLNIEGLGCGAWLRVKQAGSAAADYSTIVCF